MSTHKCPGCNAVSVANSRLSCRTCWFRLPKSIRDAVWAGYKAGALSPPHRDAVREALDWYRENRPSS